MQSDRNKRPWPISDPGWLSIFQFLIQLFNYIVAFALSHKVVRYSAISECPKAISERSGNPDIYTTGSIQSDNSVMYYIVHFSTQRLKNKCELYEIELLLDIPADPISLKGILNVFTGRHCANHHWDIFNMRST